MTRNGADLDAHSVESWKTWWPDVPADAVGARLIDRASIPDLIAAQAKLYPEKVALVVDNVEVTYRELIDRTAKLAGFLQAGGVDRGDRVAVFGHNSIAMITSCLAAMWTGGVELVLNPALKPREVETILSDARPAAALVDATIEGASGLFDGIPLVRHLESDVNFEYGSVWSEPTAVAAPAPQMRPEEIASLQYTSGTTGTPKGAMLSHGNLVAYLRTIHITWAWTADDVLLHSLPMSHGHGRNGVYTALMVGATARVHKRTNAEALIDDLENATILYSVPAIWERLLASSNFDARKFARLRFFTSGSAPLSPALSDEIKRLIGERPLERYGATETGLAVTNLLDGPRYAGTVGVPVPGAEVRIIDGDGHPVPLGGEGEIAVRGPAVFSGYLNLDIFGPADEGWFRTGDVGKFDADRGHFLSITGRIKEMIITGGLNVYPREIELLAEELPTVQEAAVIGVPSKEWGEQVVIAVVPQPGCTVRPDEVIEHLRPLVAGYKLPKECKVIEVVPRNMMGKILRSELSAGWSPGC